ncbi:hypothetical protein HH310_21225 [Actinoplanes sp. TBRC 11911]|uniref:hypothetical protein n=1 Tax=Actinoplanes sp. TBRC 11911 TaxID=2729386 RepID=UPI00145EBCEF|nr:hypothetical protein [Actinoplanes sp. TBRC 11911]NMO53695.1 hypothetical protein [Actinoplanes sp. TBRC 11911]
MGASKSNLSDPKWGYDYVVATTQASINSTMKWFLSELTEPVVTVCYVADAKGQPQEIPYEELLDRAQGSDPFSVPAGADPMRDEDLAHLLKARFMMGFRAQLGLPPMSKPETVPDIVELGPTGNVLYRLLCSEFELVNLDPGGGYSSPSWTSLSQEADEPWVFESNVELRFEDVEGSRFNKLPDEVKLQIKNLSGTAFSVQQLLFDLDNATLESVPQLDDQIKPTHPAYTMLVQYFLGAYILGLRAQGDPVLACAITQQEPSPATMALTDMTMQVMPWTGDDGLPAAHPSPAQRDLATLDYLCVAGRTGVQPAGAFTWNWVDEPAGGAAPDHDGVVAINRVPFFALIKDQLLPSVKANCYQPSVTVSLSGASQPIYTINVTPGQTPVIVDGPMKRLRAGRPVIMMSFSYDASASDQAGLGGDLGKASLSTHYNASVEVLGNKITVYQFLQFKMSVTKALQTVNGTPISINRTDTCTLTIDDFGQLVASMATPQPPVNEASNEEFGSFMNLFVHLNEEYDSASAYLQQMVGTMLSSLPFSTVQYFVFPGGRTFAFKDVAFTESGDLVAHISYADPDQGPPPHYLPAGQVEGADRLVAGQWLANGGFLVSNNGRYAAVLQNDGNFVLVHAVDGAPDLSKPYWSVASKQPGLFVGQPGGVPYVATMQSDGNFVLYNGTSPLNLRSPYWASGTAQSALGSYVAVLRDDGNFMVCTSKPGTPSEPDTVVFASNTTFAATPAPLGAAAPAPAAKPAPAKHTSETPDHRSKPPWKKPSHSRTRRN